MYVCVCHAVTEKHVNEAISRGCRSVRDLGELLGVGGALWALQLIHIRDHPGGLLHQVPDRNPPTFHP